MKNKKTIVAIVISVACVSILAGLFVYSRSDESVSGTGEAEEQNKEFPQYYNADGEPVEYKYLDYDHLSMLTDDQIEVTQYERYAEDLAVDIKGNWVCDYDNTVYKFDFKENCVVVRNENEKTTVTYGYSLKYGEDNPYDVSIFLEKPLLGNDCYQIDINESYLYLTTEYEEDGMVLKHE